MRNRLYVWVLLLGSCFSGKVNADLPPATYLKTPTSGQERFFPAADSEVQLKRVDFELPQDDECIVRVSCSGSLEPGYGIAISRNADGSYLVTGVRDKWNGETHIGLSKSSAVLEKTLGERFCHMLLKELSRVVPGSSDKRVYLDTATYLFWAKSEHGYFAGKTNGSFIANSRLERFENLSKQLCSFAFAGESDRTEILGVIDRFISEIELANELLK